MSKTNHTLMKWKLLRTVGAATITDAAWADDVSVGAPSDTIYIPDHFSGERVVGVEVCVLAYINSTKYLEDSDAGTVSFSMQPIYVDDPLSTASGSVIKGQSATSLKIVRAGVNGAGYEFNKIYQLPVRGPTNFAVRLTIGTAPGSADRYEVHVREILQAGL